MLPFCPSFMSGHPNHDCSLPYPDNLLRTNHLIKFSSPDFVRSSLALSQEAILNLRHHKGEMLSCPIFAASINPYHSPSEIELVSIAFPPWTSQPSYALLMSPPSTNIESEWLGLSHYPLQRCNIIIPIMGLNGRTIRVSWDCRFTRAIGYFNRHFSGPMARSVILGGYVECYPNLATSFPPPFPMYQCNEAVPRFLGWQAMSVPSSSRMAAHSPAIPEDYISGMLPVDPFGMDREENEHWD